MAAYIKFDGVDGESKAHADENHDKWIDILSMQTGHSGSPEAGGADELGVPDGEPEPVLVGLLLPAVQKVREAAADAGDGPGAVQAEEEAEAAIGLLLPAVQKVREAAADAGEPQSGGEGRDTIVEDERGPFVMVDEAPVIGLLLPAVQKVRAAEDEDDTPVGPGAGPVVIVFDGVEEALAFGNDQVDGPRADTPFADPVPFDDMATPWRGGDVVAEDGFV